MQNRTTLTSRNMTADFIKGFLILCVMYGHSVSMVNNLRGISWIDSPVNVFVTSFEMPLFILISGYFLAFSLKNRSFGSVLWKRILAIGIPLAIWEGIPAAMDFFQTLSTQGFQIRSLLRVAYQCVFPGKLWFLVAYLICSIIVICVEWGCSLLKNQKLSIAVSLILYTGICLGLQFVPYSLSSAQYLLPFFVIGFMLAKYKLPSNKYITVCTWVLAALFFLLYPFYKPENSFYLNLYMTFGNIRAQLPFFLHRFILALCACCGIYGLSDLLCRHTPGGWLTKSFSRLGTVTMELYILSMYIQELLCRLFSLILPASLITDLTAPLLFGPIFLAVLLTVCLLLIGLFRKIPFLQKLLFGR